MIEKLAAARREDVLSEADRLRLLRGATKVRSAISDVGAGVAPN
jgi:hypothetical protein